LIVYLVISWVIVCFTQIKGVKTFGKVSYITALGPYILLSILLIRVVTLEGSWNGIKLFFTPDFSKLIDVKVWYEAAMQCFFSLNIYFACIIMYSSYNKFNHNISRDSNIISIVDTFTSLFAGVITFATVGHICHTVGYDINDPKIIKSISEGPCK
jgi:solute carrier family 6 amino acid transporter-like protein 5/7/9/14